MWTIQIALLVGGVRFMSQFTGGLGLAGALTNGVMRDLDVIDDGFPVLAGSIGPSHGFVHVVEIGTPVNIKGMRVAQGELIHADRHGALVIPHDTIPDLGMAIQSVIESEAIILGPRAST